ncbi:MAG TPA: hypothetical protein VIL48_03785 [Acidimicrobiales bacterium]
MTEEHKMALAEGREQGRIVRRYLEALESHKPRRGRKRSPEAIKNRLEAIEAELPSADPLKRLHLVQERLDLQNALEASSAGEDFAELEEQFVKVAASYGERKGISYTAWRELGVPPAVLSRAGISRGG